MTTRSRAAAALVTLLAALVPASAGCSPAAPAAPDVVTVSGSPSPSRAAPPAPGSPVAEPPVTQPPAGDDGAPAELLAEIEDQVFALANDARAAEGLAPLTRMPELDAVARGWSQTLATDGRELGHNPDYSRQIPSGWSVSGENVGWMGELAVVPAEEVSGAVHQGWMESPGHRENLLSPEYTHMGVGVAHSPESGYYLTQNFAAY